MLRTAFGPSLCKPVFICRSVVRFASILLLCLIVRENAPAEEEVIRLWPGAAPGSESWTQKEVRFNDARHGGEAIRNVVDPTLKVSLPKPGTANGTAVIVCRGGAFQFLRAAGSTGTPWFPCIGFPYLRKFFDPVDPCGTSRLRSRPFCLPLNPATSALPHVFRLLPLKRSAAH